MFIEHVSGMMRVAVVNFVQFIRKDGEEVKDTSTRPLSEDMTIFLLLDTTCPLSTHTYKELPTKPMKPLTEHIHIPVIFRYFYSFGDFLQFFVF